VLFQKVCDLTNFQVTGQSTLTGAIEQRKSELRMTKLIENQLQKMISSTNDPVLVSRLWTKGGNSGNRADAGSLARS
jgi:hypothetical protein